MRVVAWLYIVIGGLVFLMGAASIVTDIQIIVALCGVAIHGIGLLLLAVLKIGDALARPRVQTAVI